MPMCMYICLYVALSGKNIDIQRKILSNVEGKLKAHEDLVLPGKVVEVVPYGTYFVLKKRKKTQH